MGDAGSVEAPGQLYQPVWEGFPEGDEDPEERLGANGDVLFIAKEHWVHIRTTNVVESPFSAVRLRTDAAKRYRKVQNATAMIWKLLGVAEKRSAVQGILVTQGCLRGEALGGDPKNWTVC